MYVLTSKRGCFDTSHRFFNDNAGAENSDKLGLSPGDPVQYRTTPFIMARVTMHHCFIFLSHLDFDLGGWMDSTEEGRKEVRDGNKTSMIYFTIPPW
jgi:hypothetical protein